MKNAPCLLCSSAAASDVGCKSTRELNASVLLSSATRETLPMDNEVAADRIHIAQLEISTRVGPIQTTKIGRTANYSSASNERKIRPHRFPGRLIGPAFNHERTLRLRRKSD